MKKATREKTISEMFDAKQASIQARINAKDIKTGIGWAVNNVVQIMIAKGEKDFSNGNIKRNARDFLKLAKEMYEDEINRISKEYEMEEKHFESRDFADDSPLS